MGLAFIILSALTLAGAVAAVWLRNPIHCALAAAVSFIGLAGHYLRLNAQFAGLAQLLVYIGAIAILIVFAILLTRSGENPAPRWSSRYFVGFLTASFLALLLFFSVAGSGKLAGANTSAPQAALKELGRLLMTRYVLPLEIVGILLTASLIAAILLAMPSRPKGGGHE